MTSHTLPAREATTPDYASSFAVEVDLDAVAGNVAALRDRVAGADVMAVVKADAYGHGLIPAARAALRGGAAALGVAQLGEAVAARDAGIDAPMLTWLYSPGADVAGALSRGIEVTVSSQWQLDSVVDAARESGATAPIHLKVDTGLARGGALLDDAGSSAWHDLVAAVAPLAAEGVIRVEGMWQHFVYADAPEHPTVRGQQKTFHEAVRIAERTGIHPGRLHIANSAATLTNPSAYLDMVRPGLAVYGLSPVPDLGRPEDYGLREAMRLTARLSLVKRVKAGQGVSYGHTWHADRDTVIGLVPMGYADGIPRSAGNLGPIQVAGGPHTPLAGRVCMDQIMVDLGPDFAGSAGDEVVIFGRGGDGEPTAQDWAEAAGTINYEIVTRLAPRATRRYVGEGSA
ncbi:MAG: alanine racemase [Intrasporangiaceae bacterium]|nr:alanine racemase [Intrasporangiaceae bacterium]